MLRERGGPQVDEKLNQGIQFAQIYYIKLHFNSFYILLYQRKSGPPLVTTSLGQRVSTIVPMHKDYIFQLKSPFQIFFLQME